VPSARLPANRPPDARALLRRGLAESHRGKFHALQTLAAAEDAFRANADASGVALSAAALLLTGQAISRTSTPTALCRSRTWASRTPI
jgi:hypothetical protein